VRAAANSKRLSGTDSRPTCRDVQDCRVGDWQHVSFVYEWRGKSGIQKYQPADREQDRRCAFDEADFTPGAPVWKFQKQIWPGMLTSSDTWDVWLRIE
jgi:hypothetical protein